MKKYSNGFFKNFYSKAISILLNAFVIFLFISIPVILMFAHDNSDNNGIHAATTGQTVYIAGESCTVNMTKEIKPEDMKRDFKWCMEKHAEYFPFEESEND